MQQVVFKNMDVWMTWAYKLCYVMVQERHECYNSGFNVHVSDDLYC